MSDIDTILNSPRLPSVPGVAIRLLELTRQEDSGIRDIIEVIQADPALTARIIQAANASSLGVNRQVTSLDLAVALLGKTIVVSLTLSFSLIPQASAQAQYRDYFSTYWLRSVVQATAAKRLGDQIPDHNSDDLFLVGLLCDLGQLALLCAVPHTYTRILDDARNLDRDLVDVEREQLGFTHAQVGFALADRWNLPLTVQTGLKTHHGWRDDASDSDFHNIEKSAIFASLVADLLLTTSASGRVLQSLQAASQEFFQVDEETLQEWLLEMRREVDKNADLLSADANQLGDTDAILWEANNQLLQITLAAQVKNQQITTENSELREQNRQLAFQSEDLRNSALQDALTELPNPHFLKEYLPREISRCQRMQVPIGALFCDVDRFKSINDTYGHATGNEVLRKVARGLENSIRKSDVIVRYGGEEFLIIASGVTHYDLERVAERVRSIIEGTVIEANGASLGVTICVGGAMATPTGRDLDREHFAKSLIECADRAMYECKRSGRNQCKIVECTAQELATVLPPLANSAQLLQAVPLGNPAC